MHNTEALPPENMRRALPGCSGLDQKRVKKCGRSRLGDWTLRRCSAVIRYAFAIATEIIKIVARHGVESGPGRGRYLLALSVKQSTGEVDKASGPDFTEAHSQIFERIAARRRNMLEPHARSR